MKATDRKAPWPGDSKAFDELETWPAPWTFSESKPAVYDRNGRCIADCEIHFDHARDVATARLISKAHAMYEALREVVRDGCVGCGYKKDGTCKRGDKFWSHKCEIARYSEILEEAGG